MTCRAAQSLPPAGRAGTLQIRPCARCGARRRRLRWTRRAAEGKHVLVDVGGEWCAWCHILDRFFAGDAEARALRDRNYVAGQGQLVAGEPQRGAAVALAEDRRLSASVRAGWRAAGSCVRSRRVALELGRGYDRDKVIAFLRRYAPRHAATAAPSRTLIPGLSASAPACACCASAHATCSRTSADGSSRARSSAATIVGDCAAHCRARRRDCADQRS